MPAAMSEKEVEASLSLLHMMQPTSVAAGLDRDVAPVEVVVKTEGLHDSLLRVVASQADALAIDVSEKENANWTPRGFLKRNAQLTTLSRELSLNELRGHFGKPIVEVAKEFGICTTFLKKICRRCGIKRWPHRQIRSLSRTIQMLHQAEVNASSPQERMKFSNQIAQLEAKKRAVIEDPDANGKLKRIKNCSSKRRQSSSTGNHNVDVDMDMSEDDDEEKEDEEGEDAERLAQASPLIATQVDPKLAKSELAVCQNFSQADASPPANGFDSVDRGASVETSAATPPPSQPFPSTPTSTASSKVNATSPSLSSFSAGDGEPTIETSGLKISPSHRKLLDVSKYDAEKNRFRSSSMGSLRDEGEHMEALKPVKTDASSVVDPTTR
uniref:RWP-RK domain-containing protein n=1 Tax=Globisporangium ultimum (strain ATCC 200006 / CBS 805.95 / DAOM BR144) TaxID=431595 RepID=K3WWV5_GLOUD